MKKVLLIVVLVVMLALAVAQPGKAANVAFPCRENDSCPTFEKFTNVEKKAETEGTHEPEGCLDCGHNRYSEAGPHSDPLDGCGNMFSLGFGPQEPSPEPNHK
jgi:hypothetical protein